MSSRTPNDRLLFASLREIGAAAQIWENELGVLVDAAPASADAKRDAVAGSVRREPQIAALIVGNIEAIRAVFAADVEEHEWGAAVLVELDLRWKGIENLWPPPDDPDRAMATLAAVRDRLDEIVFCCISNTITPDINDRLPNLEVGQVLDLSTAFCDSLPRSKDRQKRLFAEIEQEQAVIEGGIFDPDQCVVYRIANTAAERRMSCWRVLALIALGALLTVAACFPGLWLPDWPLQPERWRPLLANYVFLFIGAAAHTIIDALKQQRARTGKAFYVMDNWILWLHVRERSVMLSVLWADVGFVLLTAMVSGLDWRAAFLAGYSIDSITDLFLSRFETVVTEADKILTK